tara:strand:+ start:1201 stop:1371 length:171 start_codon:yes stop_codon:yes gene_type:complete
MELVTCPECNGEGTEVYDVPSIGRQYLTTFDETCELCNGCGSITKAELEDLGQEDQ